MVAWSLLRVVLSMVVLIYSCCQPLVDGDQNLPYPGESDSLGKLVACTANPNRLYQLLILAPTQGPAISNSCFPLLHV